MRASAPYGFDLWDAVDGIREAIGGGGGRLGARDIRSAILAELVDGPLNGYEIIHAIEARTGGAWTPSPGSVYPTLQLLADEGLVAAEQVGERKVFSLTEVGKAAAADTADAGVGGESTRARAERNLALPKAGSKLAQAAAQVMQNGTPEQTERAVAIIDEARRKLYALLAED